MYLDKKKKRMCAKYEEKKEKKTQTSLSVNIVPS